MNSFMDGTFGKLDFDYAWIGLVEFSLFGKNYSVELIVEGNDSEETVRDEQRESFLFFKSNINSLSDSIENIILSYIDEILKSRNQNYYLSNNIVDYIEPTGVVFPMVMDEGDISFGIFFESPVDEEHGIGILYLNGSIDVSTQDIIT